VAPTAVPSRKVSSTLRLGRVTKNANMNAE